MKSDDGRKSKGEESFGDGRQLEKSRQGQPTEAWSGRGSEREGEGERARARESLGGRRGAETSSRIWDGIPSSSSNSSSSGGGSQRGQRGTGAAPKPEEMMSSVSYFSDQQGGPKVVGRLYTKTTAQTEEVPLLAQAAELTKPTRMGQRE
ncbi:hypothetical protein ASPBRDRAFT_255952 [Aspergillus brasiliensis CBS 101740]|uniref:Uncharacterized protein n=1 Tax=Aspergillus brasiliensis (strain CBS 101740 / IMI 381727 / IBT 21946) TaxID=767769 RepID=A0A1L9V2C8_ASPBC|nr:hypothetical protein ASPBRDRAFT_255952 [Aspergillus brasiliensis CBS 101740]